MRAPITDKHLLEMMWERFPEIMKRGTEQPAQKCSYPYCGCNSKAWCKVERNEALDKKAENARELGLDYEPAQQEPVAYWIPKAEQFCIADPSGRPFAKAWEPLYTSPPAQQQEPVATLKDEVIGCFNAAFIEGLQEALAETQDERLKDLVERRLMYALYAAQDTSPPAQRTWVGLTHEEHMEIMTGTMTTSSRMAAVEAKLREKNT